MKNNKTKIKTIKLQYKNDEIDNIKNGNMKNYNLKCHRKNYSMKN